MAIIIKRSDDSVVEDSTQEQRDRAALVVAAMRGPIEAVRSALKLLGSQPSQGDLKDVHVVLARGGEKAE